jgi:hypothetical protein
MQSLLLLLSLVDCSHPGQRAVAGGHCYGCLVVALVLEEGPFRQRGSAVCCWLLLLIARRTRSHLGQRPVVL